MGLGFPLAFCHTWYLDGTFRCPLQFVVSVNASCIATQNCDQEEIKRQVEASTVEKTATSVGRQLTGARSLRKPFKRPALFRIACSCAVPFLLRIMWPLLTLPARTPAKKGARLRGSRWHHSTVRRDATLVGPYVSQRGHRTIGRGVHA